VGCFFPSLIIEFKKEIDWFMKKFKPQFVDIIFIQSCELSFYKLKPCGTNRGIRGHLFSLAHKGHLSPILRI